MTPKKYDYREVYLAAKELGKKAACEMYGINMTRMNTIICVGDDLMKNEPIPKNAKTIDKFQPRELMEELARRGYTGQLSYTQKIDITSF